MGGGRVDKPGADRGAAAGHTAAVSSGPADSGIVIFLWLYRPGNRKPPGDGARDGEKEATAVAEKVAAVHGGIEIPDADRLAMATNHEELVSALNDSTIRELTIYPRWPIDIQNNEYEYYTWPEGEVTLNMDAVNLACDIYLKTAPGPSRKM